MPKGDYLINAFHTVVKVTADEHDPVHGLVSEEHEDEYLGEFRKLDDAEAAPPQHWEAEAQREARKAGATVPKRRNVSRGASRPFAYKAPATDDE